MESPLQQRAKLEKPESAHPQRCSLKDRQSQWKEKLRKECFLRVTEQRAQLIWNSRLSNKSGTGLKESLGFAIEKIVSHEIEKLKKLPQGSIQTSSISKDDDLWNYEALNEMKILSNEEYEALLIEMERLLYEETESELKQRDAALLEDYEKSCALEEECQIAAALEHMKIEEQEIVCPLCRKGYLNQQQQLISCNSCHFQLDTQSDEFNLEFLRRRLSEVLEEHYDRGCKSQPGFSIECEFDMPPTLFMICNTCQAFEVVL